MSSFFYMLSALFAMLPSPFLFKGKMPLPLRGAFLCMVLLADELFVFLVFSPEFPRYEILPFRLFALTLCVSTLFLSRRRRFFESLTTLLWVWIDFFGMLSQSYRGVDMNLWPFCLLAFAFLPIFKMHPYKRETRFLLAVIWVAAWTLFFRV